MTQYTDDLNEQIDMFEVENAQLQDVADAMEADMDRLQAIVDKLPKTADGVPITPGMNLYCNRDGHTQGAGSLATWHDCHELYLTFRDTSGREWHSSPDTCYSTLEAAEAARDE